MYSVTLPPNLYCILLPSLLLYTVFCYPVFSYHVFFYTVFCYLIFFYHVFCYPIFCYLVLGYPVCSYPPSYCKLYSVTPYSVTLPPIVYCILLPLYTPLCWLSRVLDAAVRTPVQCSQSSASLKEPILISLDSGLWLIIKMGLDTTDITHPPPPPPTTNF